jgi:pyruvate formate lyase activating enzyme
VKEGMYYKKVPVGKVRCFICPHRCLFANGKTGICKVRANKDGVLYLRTYGEITSYAVDPIEKKPLYHFYPGSGIFSIGSWGCNFKCTFCQNWQISQQEVAGEKFTPEDIVEIASHDGSIGIAYTYNEPFMMYEFMLDAAKLAHAKGLKNVIVTNGFVSEEPLREILPYIDAMNIDLKAGNESFYREVCDGQLEPVMRTIKTAYEAGCHVELTNLIIPTLNDRMDELKEIVEWVASVSGDIPLHFSRYFPNYKMNIDPTPVETLLAAYEVAAKELHHVYLGNVSTSIAGNDTKCPHCHKTVIERRWPEVKVAAMKGDKCGHCGEKIYGKF